MFCSHCGSSVENTQNFCSECGHSFQDLNDLENSPETLRPPLRKFRPIWFYGIFLFSLLLMCWGFYSSYTSQNRLENIAKAQLEEIRGNQITKAYYEHSSSQFKEKTSLDEFRKFIENNPGLSDFQKVEFKEGQQEKNFGVVFGDLYILDDILVPVKYEFVKEDGEWRILHIDLEAPRILMPELDAFSSEAVSFVKKHLDEIRQGNIKLAYEQFSSDEFKASTSFNTFKKLIEKNPHFSNYEDLDLLPTEAAHQMLKITTVLYKNGSILPLEYTLLNENGSWKVWNLQVIQSPFAPEGSSKDESVLLQQPIDEFLEALSQGNLDRAYYLTSIKFQKTLANKANSKKTRGIYFLHFFI